MDNAQLLFTHKYLFLCSVIIFIDIVSFLSIAVYKFLNGSNLFTHRKQNKRFINKKCMNSSNKL